MRTALQDAMPDEAYSRGQRDYADGIQLCDCPYLNGTGSLVHWRRGWENKRREHAAANLRGIGKY